MEEPIERADLSSLYQQSRSLNGINLGLLYVCDNTVASFPAKASNSESRTLLGAYLAFISYSP